MPTSIDKAVLVEHVRQERQKADDIKVPLICGPSSSGNHFFIILVRTVEGKEATQTFIGDMIRSAKMGCQKVEKRQCMDLDDNASDGVREENSVVHTCLRRGQKYWGDNLL